ncbi:MAG: GGDEF domain-containing protein [Myxococcaceae bacterium]|nr:GGDEF domain-containing protein [Myxococcaceae bacterium]
MTLPDTVENQVVPQPGGRGRKLAMLVVVSGSETDLGAHARVERRVVIGRDPLVELSLSDARASKQHAAVELVDGLVGSRYEVKDLGSTNGTLVNGKPVKTSRKLRDGDKITVAGTVLRFTIADEMEVAFQAQVETMLSTDALTGLLAPRKFDAALGEAVRAARNKSSRLALVVLDLDDLKQINEAHGHAMGAHTIAQVGQLIAEVVGVRGTATRFGGDEFVVFLPGFTEETATALADELRERVAAHRFERDGKVVTPTISAGISVYPDRADSAKALFDAADRALYRAKARGKNRVAR